MCDNDGVTATTNPHRMYLYPTHPLVSAARCAADANPEIHNGYNDCDDADCVPCALAIDALARQIDAETAVAA